MKHTIRYKTECAEKLKQFQTFIEKQIQRKVWVVHSDEAGEYLSEKLQLHFTTYGTDHKQTVAYTLGQNEVFERMSKTLGGLVRSTVQSNELRKTLRAKALATAVYIWSHVASSALPSDTSSYQI